MNPGYAVCRLRQPPGTALLGLHWLRFLRVPSTHTHTPSLSILQLGCFDVFAIVNSVAVNIGVNISFQLVVLSSCMPKSRIYGSFGNSIFSFWFFEEPPYCFP